MDKYNKHRFFTTLALRGIRASFYSTPSDAIFMSKFHHFLKLTQPSKFNEQSLFFVCDRTQHRTTFSNYKICLKSDGQEI